MTKLNQKILEMIRNSDGHLTAEQVFLLAKRKKIDVSMASVYRILGKLADEGYIKRFSVAGKPDVFDKTLQDHEHLICSRCGKVSDIHIPKLKDKLSKQTKIDIEAISLSLNYVCEDCKKKER